MKVKVNVTSVTVEVYQDMFSEIRRGLRLFGCEGECNNELLIRNWKKEYEMTDEEISALRAYNKRMAKLPEYQF